MQGNAAIHDITVKNQSTLILRDVGNIAFLSIIVADLHPGVDKVGQQELHPNLQDADGILNVVVQPRDHSPSPSITPF